MLKVVDTSPMSVQVLCPVCGEEIGFYGADSPFICPNCAFLLPDSIKMRIIADPKERITYHRDDKYYD